MAWIIKKHINYALFLVLVVTGVASADIKLRLYLKDGSLQAGNLVVESDQSFVILDKNGREEIPKDKIMFVNGKSLQYWRDHPEKNYQTEIIPSEIPNPAYVNDKAALPPPPAVPKIAAAIPTPTAIPQAKSVSTPSPVVKAESKANSVSTPAPKVKAEAKAKPVTTPAPQVKQSSAEKSVPVSPSAAGVKNAAPSLAPVIVSKPSRNHRRHQVPAAGSAAVAAASHPSAAIATGPHRPPPPASGRPSSLERERMAAYHAERARDFLKAGQPGKAMQELHYTTILDLHDTESALLLARLYVAEDNAERAAKLLANPGLRKNEQAKMCWTDMATRAHSQDLHKWILVGSTAAGFLFIGPLLLLIRRWTRRSPPALVLSADQIESPIIPMVVGEIQPNFVDEAMTNSVGSPDEQKKKIMEEIQGQTAEMELEEPEAVVPHEIKLDSPPPAFTEPPSQQLPRAQKQDEVKSSIPEMPTEQPAKSEPPVFKDLTPLAENNKPTSPESVTPPPLPPVDEKVKPAEVGSRPSEPKQRSIDELLKSREDFLALSRTVDDIVSKGHARVAEGDNEGARKEYRTALALHPQCVEAVLGLAYLCFIGENWELALDHYLHAIQIHSKSADAHYGVGRVFLETGHVAEAVEEFRKTLSLDPTFYEARETLTALGVAV